MRTKIVMFGLLAGVCAAMGGTIAATSVIEPLPGERWWGGVPNDGAKEEFPYVSTSKPVDLSRYNHGGTTSPLLVSTMGRYVWSDRPFTYAFTNGTLYVTSSTEKVEPVVAGTTLKEAYLAACRKHFPFSGTIPADLLFTKPQWNNWIEIAIQGWNQKVVDAYTDAIAANDFPCGVYMMDGGWFSHQGSYKPDLDLFPDMKAMFRRVHDHGWKAMIWTAHFMSPDSIDHKLLRHGKGYMRDGADFLAYKRYTEGQEKKSKAVGVIWWWSGVSATWDLTYKPAWEHYATTLETFAKEYGVDGFKFDAGDPARLFEVRFHDDGKEPVDFSHEYVRVGAERFKYNEYRSGFCTGGWPVMQRLHDQGHTWVALKRINACMLAEGLIGSPYCVADMVGGGLAGSYRPSPTRFFSEKLFVRLCAQQALHPMMQFSAAPWRYLSPEGVAACRTLANLHVKFGPYILEQARHASKTGEPIMRTMEYEFPHAGFEGENIQYMLGPKYLVAPVVEEDDSVVVKLPAGTWTDDLGEKHVGPKTLKLEKVPLDRLPWFAREGK